MKSVADKSRQNSFRAKILLADDNPVNQTLARQMLEALGCDVEIAGDGKEAVTAFGRSSFDLVFMDCQMPRLDGYHASMIIRDMEKTGGTVSHVPIVAVTAHADKQERLKCMSSGMDDYLNKPFKKHQLESLLKKWLPPLAESPGDSPCDEAGKFASCPGSENEEVIDKGVLDSIRKMQLPGKEDLLGKVVGMFIDLLPEQLAALRQAVGDNDGLAVERVAHKLKSSCGNLGASAMSELCREMEILGKSGDLSRASSVLDRIESEAVKVRSALAAEMRDSI